MRKVDSTLRLKFKMPSLHREDLKKIEEILFEIPDRRSYRIEVNGFEYESIDEIPTNCTTANKIDISIHNPYIHLSLNQFEAEVYGSGDDETQLMGTMTRISAVMRKSERKFRWFNARVLIVIFPAIFLNLLLESTEVIKMNASSTKTIVTILTLAALFICFLIGVKDSMFSFSRISFSTKSDVINWFTKNRDQIIQQVIGAMCAGLVGYMLGKLG